MDFATALTLSINEEWGRHVAANERLGGLPSTPRDVFALTCANFIIAARVHSMCEFPDDTTYGTFYNCREYGVTYHRRGWTFALYEHRNSDQIILNGCPDPEVQSYGPYGDVDDKHNYFVALGPEDYWPAADALKQALSVASPALTRQEMKDLFDSDFAR
ncbi:hypothetical protein SEA_REDWATTLEHOG_198 [Gordonia phage RedWattleHog]|uniref:Uncharacterized protein n=1 Tax=Gordonia phage Stormageddon TaxID=2656541 RepID=A0A649VSY0_9CAUD|nr:hypothetical protein KHQ86_gp101 [Gordonia phage Stormageddon]QGJ95059.1 hypothetical protein SEA_STORMAGEDDON_199 [Gordonia phage Stormageddon]QLF83701.1 hypothetical protein SEA_REDWATTLEHOG_198 [Gordonia phage RedWattleHog]